MPTASEVLQEEAPRIWERVLDLEARLLERAEPLRSTAQDLGLWQADHTDEELLEGSPVTALRDAGLLGTGITRDRRRGEYVPVLIVRIDRPEVLLSTDVDDAPRGLGPFWSLLRMVDELPPGTAVLGLPEPIAFVGPGDEAWCGAPPGTFGARVLTPTGTRGILTAGHVAPHLGASAYTSGASYVGQVVDTHDIAPPQPGVACIDIALVEISAGIPDTGAFSLSGTAPVPALPWDDVVAHGAVTNGANATVLTGGRPFAGPSRMHGLWDEAVITDRPISVGGDSGGMVLDRKTGGLVGHVVGGYPGVYCVFQDATAQLRKVGATLR